MTKQASLHLQCVYAGSMYGCKGPAGLMPCSVYQRLVINLSILGSDQRALI